VPPKRFQTRFFEFIKEQMLKHASDGIGGESMGPEQFKQSFVKEILDGL